MKKEWVDPNQIFVHRELNNREMNQNFIGDLSQSMTDKGFLPEFPIDVFPTKNLANIDAEQAYVCACGAHRTIAAINAKLDRVLVHIHDGREEAFIEMMHHDNFQFDPAQHSGIAQPFTQKEKRAAVTQLLLLPKFFEQTNTALQEAWRVPESNIRRWRKEVIELLETDSPKLQLWCISDGRLARLRELAEKQERVNSDGKTVKIRKPLAEATEAEKHHFYDQMEEDSWVPGEEHGFEWVHVCEYMQKLWKTDDGRWYIYKEVTLQQMQKVHQLLLSEDPEFIKAVQKIAKAEKRNKVMRANLNKAADLTLETFKKIFAPKEDKYSKEYKDVRSRFETFLRNSDPKYADIGIDYYGYDWKDRDDPDFCEKHAELHNEIVEALTGEAEWIAEFRAKETKRMHRVRENAMKRWEKLRKAAIEALAAYPRKIAPDTLISYADRQLDWGKGRLPKLIEADAPSTSKFTSSITEEADLFNKLVNALNNDAPWVKEIPEPTKLIDNLVDEDEQVDENRDAPFSFDTMSFRDIFEHIKARFDDLPTVAPDKMEEARREILSSLGSLMYGDIDIQIWMLADIGMWLSQIKSEKSE